MMNVPRMDIQMRLLPGMSVRDSAHASGKPNARHRSAEDVPRIREFTNASR